MAEAVKPKTKKRGKSKSKAQVKQEPADVYTDSLSIDTESENVISEVPSATVFAKSDVCQDDRPEEGVTDGERQETLSHCPVHDPVDVKVDGIDPGGAVEESEQSDSRQHEDTVTEVPNRDMDHDERCHEKQQDADEKDSVVNSAENITELQQCDPQTNATSEQLNQIEPAEIGEPKCDVNECDAELVVSPPLIIQRKWHTEPQVIVEAVEIAACPSGRRPDVPEPEQSGNCKHGVQLSHAARDLQETSESMNTIVDVPTSPTAHQRIYPQLPSVEQGQNQEPSSEQEQNQEPPDEQEQNQEPSSEQEQNRELPGEEEQNREPPGEQEQNREPPGEQEQNREPTGEPEQDQAPPGEQEQNQESSSEQEQNQEPPSEQEQNQEPFSEQEISCPVLEPFTEEQLRSLYHNPQLQRHEQFVEEFLEDISKKNSDFYEVVLNYYRARNKLSSAEHDVQVLQKDYRRYKDLVWELREQKLTVQGQCADKSKVTAEVLYCTAEFDVIASDDIRRTLRDVRKHLQEQLSLFAYEAQLSRLQVESHLHHLYAKNSGLCGIPPNSPVQALLPHNIDDSVTPQVAALKAHLTVLFMFQRKPAKDDIFVKDCQQWIDRLVATLLRVASLEDHLYVVHQVLRCPAGVGRWGAGFVQAAPPLEVRGVWGNPLLDHFITVLAAVLLPVRKREEVLYQMKVVQSLTAEKQSENPWIIVDSDGEEDEDPVHTWHYLHENDLMSLLNQLPLSYAFQHVLLADFTDQGNVVYSIERTNENTMLRLFAFATCVIRLLGGGLTHFCLSRYRQLNKRLGKMIKTVVVLLSCHWESFQTAYPSLPLEISGRLQLEYNMVFQRAVYTVLSAQRLGSWQFLAQLPYKGVSLDTMWRLLWIMHVNCYPDNADEPDTTTAEINFSTLDVLECHEKLQDEKIMEEFQRKLMNMPTSEAIFLLTTFANMAQGRPSSDKHFIQTITREIYQIAYIKSHTRELCSKHGRDLLTSITATHPFVLSDLLKATVDTMDSIGMVALYLYKELPLHLWLPTPADISTLRDWLLDKHISSPENQLARLIVENLNWGFNEKGSDLFLDYIMHKEMAIILVDVYCKHLTGMNVGNLMTEGIKQVASLMRFQESEEQQLANWCWEVAQKLHLHRASQPSAMLALLGPDRDAQYAVTADLYKEVSLQLIVAAINKNFALAAYLGLVLSKYSHNVADFCTEGVKLLGSLSVKSHHIPVIRVLQDVTPMFYTKESYLLDNSTFLQVMKMLMQADSLKRGMFFNVFPGPITKLFAGALQVQIQEAGVPGGAGVGTVALFWVKVIVKLDNWNSDRDVLYVIDKLLEAVFLVPDAWSQLSEHFSKLFRSLITKDTDPTLLSSLSSLFGTAKPLPSLVENPALGEFPWFMYMVLEIESVYEDEGSLLWPKLQAWLHENPDCSVEVALQGVCNKLKFCMSRSPGRLCVYRWVQQALAMELHHPLLPLVWQRFLRLYLSRTAAQPGLPQRGSVGEKFFQSSANISLMKSMKKQLQSTVTYFQDKAREGRRKSRSGSGSGRTGVDSGASSEDELPDADTQNTTDGRQFCLKMARFYQTLLFWLDEPRLHDASLYLPALPPQYDPERLLTILQSNTEPWMEVFNYKYQEDEVNSLANEWYSLVSHDHFHGNKMKPDISKLNATEQIVALLSQNAECRPPPSLVEPRAPIPDLSPSLLTDQQNLLFALRGDLNILVDYAKLYSSRVAKHVGLDCTYIELLPNLYTNETTETAASATCRSSFNPTHRCKGAAIITCRYDAAKRNDIVSRKIEENRAEYNQVFIESLLPPPQNVCSAAVHVEFAITSLMQLLKTSGDQKVLDVGTALFYNVATFVSEDTKYYPPTCQFFSSCIEVLGQEFIRKNPTQAQPLLQTILQTPALVGLLAPNFSPTSSPELFVTMYQDMVSVPRNQGPDIAVTLLTKFEVDEWLSGKPSVSQREALLEVIGQALCQCGKQPSGCVESVFQVYRVHLFRVAKYQFPDHYGSLLKIILKGSVQEQLSAAIWKDFLHLLGCLDPFTEPSGNSVENSYASELSTQSVVETLDWMSSHFLNLRISSTNYASYGLYPQWKDYVPYLAAFLSFLLRRHITEASTRASTRAVDPETAIANLWQKLTDVFAPWIQPLESGDQLLSPWIQSDTEIADKMVQAWAGAIQTLQEQFEGLVPVFSRQALSHLWLYYCGILARRDIPKHLLSVYHSHLSALPWNKFYPGIQAIEIMMKLSTSQDCHRSSQEFLAHMFSQCPWQHISAFYTEHELPEIRMRLYVCFFTLLVRLSQEKEVFETTKLPDLLNQAENFDWNALDGVSYKTTTSWFTENCDPKCVLAERGSQQALVLRLLRVSSGFILVPNAAFHPETPVKRCAYVQCLMQLVCKCSHLKEVNPESFHLIITNLLTDVEGIAGTICDAAAQQQESAALCGEVLGVLNHCNPQGPSLKLLTQTLLGWVAHSTTSPLLLPMMSAAGRALASLTHMVRMVEACMDAYFTSDMMNTEGAGWAQLLGTLQVPELAQDKFITEALTQGCYLILYGLTLQQLPLSQSINDEMDNLKRLVFWTCKAKPSVNNEGKLLLWWDKLLELLLRQLALGGKESRVVEQLKKLVPSLVSLGEDKDHSGLLGAIGLGKKSQLSLRFRVLTNSLACFLSMQVTNDGSLRREANSPGHISEVSGSRSPTRTSPGRVGVSQHAVQCLQRLEQLQNHKKYVAHRELLQYAHTFIMDPTKSVLDSQKLFVDLILRMYPEIHYLGVVRLRPVTPYVQ